MRSSWLLHHHEKVRRADDVIAISREKDRPWEPEGIDLAWILKQAKIVITDCSLPEETLREIHSSRVQPSGGPESGIKKKSQGKGGSHTGWALNPACC